MNLNLSPIELAKEISGDYFQSPDHIKLIESIVLEAVNGSFNKIIINLPPRHGKSEFISKYLPFWFLCNFPDKKVILICYSAELAKSFGRIVLELIIQFGPQFGIEINPHSKSSSKFAFKNFRGGMDAIGALGSITGKGADLLIIDDPIKNNAQANSLKMRDNLWDWFLATAYTRLEPNGIVIIVMTRWNDDDLCGRIIKNKNYIYLENKEIIDKKNWIIVKIPAIAQNNDLLNRKYGEALWEERYSKQDLMLIKEEIGSQWFSALYQQEPLPNEGKIFNRKYFRYFTQDNEFYHLYKWDNNKESKNKIEFITYAVCDLALSLKENSDFTVIIIFAVNHDKDVLILDVIRERFEGAKHLHLIKNIFDLWQPLLMGIESVQYQKALIQTLLNKGFRVCELKPKEDKVSRALPMQARLEAGKVYFKKNALWLNEFEKELLEFPDSPHDDQVDAFAYIAFMLNKTSLDKPISKNLKNKLSANKISNGF